MLIEAVVSQIFIIMLIIFTGYLAGLLGILDVKATKSISSLLTKLVLPITVLMPLSSSIEKNALGDILIGTIIMLFYFIVGAILSEIFAKILNYKGGKKSVFIVLSVFPNSAFIGIPLLLAIFGAKGILYSVAGILSFGLPFFTYAVSKFEENSKFNKSTFLTPVNLFSVILIFAIAKGIKFPQIFMGYVTSISALTTPLALIIVGAMIVGAKFGDMAFNKDAYIINFLKCIVYPVIFVFAIAPFPISPGLKLSMTIQIACPPASTGAVLASQYGKEPQFAAQVVAQSVVLVPFTLVFILTLAQKIFY